MKYIFVTGGNDGIGLALCKQLAVDHGCYVFMGSRSLERGAAGLKSITDANPKTASTIEVVQIDVTDDASVSAALKLSSRKGQGLYALVNNAGVGLNAGGKVLPTNFYGPKRVSEAFLPLVTDRIVNVSSGAASMWLRNQMIRQRNYLLVLIQHGTN